MGIPAERAFEGGSHKDSPRKEKLHLGSLQHAQQMETVVATYASEGREDNTS